jgi:hypothetical protein
MDCHVAQDKLQKARAAKRVAEAWDISNTMRANGCPPGMLRGLKGRRRRGLHGLADGPNCPPCGFWGGMGTVGKVIVVLLVVGGVGNVAWAISKR